MKKTLFCILIGYLLGCINPASILAKKKNTNLKEIGTKNLGATNTAVALGKKYGILVMAIDVWKAFTAVKIAGWLVPQVRVVSLLAGVSAVLGHIFPVQLKFKGGKGLASFGGMILAFDPKMFPVLLIVGVILILVTQYGTALPLSAPALAPFLVGVHLKSLSVFGALCVAGGVVLYKHKENMIAIKNGTEPSFREFLEKHIHKQNKSANER